MEENIMAKSLVAYFSASGLTGKVAEEEGMVCGGVMQVLIERA